MVSKRDIIYNVHTYAKYRVETVIQEGSPLRVTSVELSPMDTSPGATHYPSV